MTGIILDKDGTQYEVNANIVSDTTYITDYTVLDTVGTSYFWGIVDVVINIINSKRTYIPQFIQQFIPEEKIREYTTKAGTNRHFSLLGKNRDYIT